MLIEGPQPHTLADYEAVLRSLPMWFGVESALLNYAQATARLPTFSVISDGHIVGFVSLLQHFPQTWEIHCIAIHEAYRGHGFGKSLLQHAETWAYAQGARFMQVKTLADSHLSPEYAQTRAFYQHMGYLPLEVFPHLWSEQHPCLVMIKALHPATQALPPDNS